ncbi:MAG TPA: aminodeoxychorismate/anthranilate synthase component II [Polyangiaceae bacterium]|jgi:anthranilate synthase component 2|nr:aminodeoxychorismate/anthranilate synthase component II [Polyangiaceae bacterium]
MLYLIDNYDSFTFNLAQYLGELGHRPRVVKNDEMTADAFAVRGAHRATGFVLSPGPGQPTESGVCLEVVRRFSGAAPILGVCLGHQAIAHVFGADVVRARKVMHGKTSEVHHDGEGVFRGLPTPIRAARYHSLIVDWSRLPSDLRVTAFTRTSDGAPDEIMGIRHVRLPVEGIQFHPESILTEHGHALLRNFCDRLS